MRLRVVHLRYPSPAARLLLITHWLPRLAPTPWCFVDIPDALEVILPAPGRPEFDQWLAACSAAGAIDEAQDTQTAQALDPRLFFGEAAPSFYVQALIVGSARTAQALSGGRASDRVV